MNTTTTRCDGIIALIDKCLAEYESATPLRVVHGTDGRALHQAKPSRSRPSRTGSHTSHRTALQLVRA